MLACAVIKVEASGGTYGWSRVEAEKARVYQQGTPSLHWTPEPVLSCSWGKPLNTRAFLRRVRPGSLAFHASAANEVSKISEQGEGRLTYTQEPELWRGGSAAGQITCDIKTTEQCAAAGLPVTLREVALT